MQRFNKSFWQIAKLILRAHFGWGLGETWAQTISSWSSCEIYKLVLGSIALIYLECFIADTVLEQVVWTAVAFLYIGKIMGRIFCSELLQENKNSFLQELKCKNCEIPFFPYLMVSYSSPNPNYFRSQKTVNYSQCWKGKPEPTAWLPPVSNFFHGCCNQISRQVPRLTSEVLGVDRGNLITWSPVCCFCG